MKIIKTDSRVEKPWAVCVDTGAVIKAFYHRYDAADFLDWVTRHPAAEAIIIDKFPVDQ